MARLSNFKGEVVAEGGECRKFALWLKHCDMWQAYSKKNYLLTWNLLNWYHKFCQGRSQLIIFTHNVLCYKSEFFLWQIKKKEKKKETSVVRAKSTTKGYRDRNLCFVIFSNWWKILGFNLPTLRPNFCVLLPHLWGNTVSFLFQLIQ